LITRVGAGPFAGLYSLVALPSFVALVQSYWQGRHDGPLLWSLRMLPGTVALALVLAAAGVALVAASFAQPSVTGMDPRAAVRARGITRITRHPFFIGVALWGTAHSLVNGFAADVLFFGGFPVFALVGAVHQDRRKQRENRERLRLFYEETSLLPFGAIVAGRNRLELSELPWLALSVGAALAVTLYLLHPLLFR